jgi:hypothetical protein
VARHSSRTPVLPADTQVVLRQAIDGRDGSTAQRGATGRVAAVDADGRYLVRLADGREVCCNRAQVSLRRAQQRDLALGRRDGESDGHARLRLRLRLDGPRLSADSGHQDPSSEAGGEVGGAR